MGEVDDATCACCVPQAKSLKACENSQGYRAVSASHVNMRTRTLGSAMAEDIPILLYLSKVNHYPLGPTNPKPQTCKILNVNDEDPKP